MSAAQKMSSPSSGGTPRVVGNEDTLPHEGKSDHKQLEGDDLSSIHLRRIRLHGHQSWRRSSKRKQLQDPYSMCRT